VPRARALPPLPKSVHSVLGPVPVLLKRHPKSSTGTRCIGVFEHRTRTIIIDTDQSHVARWQTLIHEEIELALWDNGVSYFVRGRRKEAVCDAIATARVAAMLGR
jgi:hypothetical protein